MGLGRAVEGEPSCSDTLPAHVQPGDGIAGALERDEVRDRPSRDDEAAGALRETELAGEPACQLDFDLGRGRGEEPAADVRVEAGREQICGRAGNGSRAGDIGEMGRMAGLQ